MFESNFEYGTVAWDSGKIMRLLNTMGAPATVYAVGMATGSAILRFAAEIGTQWLRGVACHGQSWIDYQFVPEEVERAHDGGPAAQHRHHYPA